MQMLKQASRVFHYCATPLLFSTTWRKHVLEKFKVPRHDSVSSIVSNVATPDTKSVSLVSSISPQFCNFDWTPLQDVMAIKTEYIVVNFKITKQLFIIDVSERQLSHYMVCMYMYFNFVKDSHNDKVRLLIEDSQNDIDMLKAVCVLLNLDIW